MCRFDKLKARNNVKQIIHMFDKTKKSDQNFEKQQKKYPSFYRLLTHILDSLKIIENEKYHLYNTCPDFNIMDAFRSLDSDGKGYIT